MYNSQDEKFNDSNFLSEVEQAADLFHLLGDLSRLRIYLLIAEHDRSVTDIVELTHLTQSNVSHHLKLLRAKGLVSSNRIGKSVIYSINKGNSLCWNKIDIVYKLLNL